MKISVITPNYNYSQYIGQTIESVVNQNYDDLEHVIIDDGSTDDSVASIKKYQQKYPQKILLFEQENCGQSRALNKALDQLNGDIIGWLNSDDTFCENIFLKIATIFEADSDLDIVMGNMNVVDLEGQLIFTRKHLKYNFTESCLLGHFTTTSSNAVFWRRQDKSDRVYFNNELNYNMDGDFFSRLFKEKKVFQLFEPIGNFRGEHSTIASERFDNWNEIVKKEMNYELDNSFSRLSVSNFVRKSNRKYIKLIFQIFRIVRRIIYFHYVSKYLQLASYKIKNLNN
mgnify:CR=1 FL=1